MAEIQAKASPPTEMCLATENSVHKLRLIVKFDLTATRTWRSASGQRNKIISRNLSYSEGLQDKISLQIYAAENGQCFSDGGLNRTGLRHESCGTRRCLFRLEKSAEQLLVGAQTPKCQEILAVLDRV